MPGETSGSTSPADLVTRDEAVGYATHYFGVAVCAGRGDQHRYGQTSYPCPECVRRAEKLTATVRKALDRALKS